jgi:hypothetical protein
MILFVLPPRHISLICNFFEIYSFEAVFFEVAFVEAASSRQPFSGHASLCIEVALVEAALFEVASYVGIPAGPRESTQQ